MKNFALYALLLLTCTRAFAQDKRLIDSLQIELLQVRNDTSRALILAELCFQYRAESPDTALQFGQEALNLSREIKFQRGEARALSNMAFVYRDLGNLPAAMDNQLKALEIAEQNNFYLEAGLSMIRLSGIYRDLADYPKAMAYLRRSFEKHEKAHNRRGIAITNMNLGLIYLDMNQLDSALYYENISLPIMDSMRLLDMYPNSFKILGDLYRKRGDTVRAVHYYMESILSGQHLHVQDNRSIATSSIRMAELYDNKKQTDSAIYYATQSLAQSQSISSRAIIIDAANLLAKLYEPTDVKKSYSYFKMAAAAKDSLLNREKFHALQSMTIEKEERDAKTAQEQKAFKNRVLLISLVTVAGIFLIAALILYRNNKQKQRTNRFLEKTLSNLKSTQSQLVQSEKMASLGELTAGIAHEIQNPLNFVNNFSEVNKELLLEMKEEIERGNILQVKLIADDIIDNEEKINHHGKRADAIVRGMLQHSRANTGTLEPTDINGLADEYLRLCYHGMRAKDKTFNTVLKTDYDPNVGTIKVNAQDIGRVILNLVNNAFYAVNQKKFLEVKARSEQHIYEPIIALSTRKADGKIFITIKDNGVGIPSRLLDKIFQPFFTTKPTGQGTGLGLSLSYDILKAHGGELKVKTKEGEGSEFIVQLPIS